MTQPLTSTTTTTAAAAAAATTTKSDTTFMPTLGVVNPPRRRLRSDVEEAKQQFMAAVDEGVSDLMMQCGYSRARAVTALLHELRRDTLSPTDDEVFRTMETYGLGVEDATRALIVSGAVQRAMTERNVSVVEAIDDLTAKLAMANVEAIREGADLSDEDDRPLSPDRRINSVTSMERTSSTSRMSLPSGSNKTVRFSAKNNSKSKSKSLVQASKLGTSPKPSIRKRSSDETTSDKKVVIARERADSVSDAVDAKVALNCKDDDGSKSDVNPTLRTATPAAAATRAKRSLRERNDDGSNTAAAFQAPLKRARASNNNSNDA